MKIVSVQDTKAQAFLNPVIQRTTAEALRTFEAQTQQEGSAFNKHPSDFILFELGEWNELTAEIIVYPKPRALATASEFISKS